jgi:hypothetical protein
MYFTLLFSSIPPSVIVSILTFRLADAIVSSVCMRAEELLVSVLIFCLGFISPSPSESDFLPFSAAAAALSAGRSIFLRPSQHYVKFSSINSEKL